MKTSLLWTVYGHTLNFAIEMHLLWNRPPQLWTLNVFLNTPLKTSLCNASQNRAASSSQNSAPLTLRHGMWRDGTIGTTYTWNSLYTGVRVCALIEQWPEKRNTLRRPWDKRPMHCKTCPMAWLWELWRYQRFWHFINSSKRSNKKWHVECPS